MQLEQELQHHLDLRIARLERSSANLGH